MPKNSAAATDAADDQVEAGTADGYESPMSDDFATSIDQAVGMYRPLGVADNTMAIILRDKAIKIENGEI